MAANTQIPALDHTVQQTNLWLKRLESEHHFESRHDAYSALRAVLHGLRDRMTPEQAAHFAAQLPMLVRGLFYEGWHIGGAPEPMRHRDEFLERVAGELPPNFPRDPLSTTEAVFDLLWHQIDPGETAKIIDSLPVSLRGLWPAEAGHARRA